jgi:hypothetical protein
MDAALARAAWLRMCGAVFLFRAPDLLDSLYRRSRSGSWPHAPRVGLGPSEKELSARDDGPVRLHAEPSLSWQLSHRPRIYRRRRAHFSQSNFHRNDFGHLSARDARRIADALRAVWQEVLAIRGRGSPFVAAALFLSQAGK